MSSENPFSDPPRQHSQSSNDTNDPTSASKNEDGRKANFRSYNPEIKKTPAHYDALTEYVKSNPKDAIAYVLLIISLLLILFGYYTGYASLIVGLIFGLYFADELAFLVTNMKEFIEEYDLVKALILGGTLLALCIQVPLFFIGTGIITIIRILWPEAKNSL